MPEHRRFPRGGADAHRRREGAHDLTTQDTRSAASAELLFERVHLPADLIRQAVAELREVLLYLRNLLAEVVRVDPAELEAVVLGEVEAVHVDLALGGHQPEQGVLRLGLALTAAEH